MAGYESEHTQWMREWMEKHPDELQTQKSGRALWWDKPQDQDAMQRLAACQVPPKPYYYDVN